MVGRVIFNDGRSLRRKGIEVSGQGTHEAGGREHLRIPEEGEDIIVTADGPTPDAWDLIDRGILSQICIVRIGIVAHFRQEWVVVHTTGLLCLPVDSIAGCSRRQRTRQNASAEWSTRSSLPLFLPSSERVFSRVSRSSVSRACHPLGCTR